jgi:4-amino-4-deoxy-L-arabinose transferase-like glycosyltransferase
MAGIWLAGILAPWGIGVGHDSVSYLSAAENLAGGHGLVWPAGGGEPRPLVHFPPLYPALLALGPLLGIKAVGFARWLAGALFGLNVFMAAWLVYEGSGSRWAAWLASLVLAVSPVFLEVHLEALSEPLYLALLQGALLLMCVALARLEGKAWIGAALLSALAYLTRYAGLSLMLTGLVAAQLWGKGEGLARIRQAARFAVVAMAPGMAWAARNYALTGTLTNRGLTVHLPTKLELTRGIQAVLGWFVTPPQSLTLQAASLALIGAGILAVVWRARGARQPEAQDELGALLGRLLALHALVYALFLAFSILFIDASTPLSNRILIPLYLCLLLMGTAWLARLRLAWRPLRLKSLALAIFLGMALVSYGFRSFSLGVEMADRGRGFSSQAWQQSPTVEYLRRAQLSGPIYSNEAFALYFLMGVPAYWVPEKIDPVRDSQRSDYAQQMALMRERLREPQAALVVFHQGYLKPGMPSLKEMAQGMRLVYDGGDGAIFLGDPRGE